MSSPGMFALCFSLGIAAQVGAQTAKVASGHLNGNVLSGPVHRIGDVRLVFPNSTIGFTPNGKTLVGADSGISASIVVVDVSSGVVRGALEGNDQDADQLAFTPDSRQVWTGPHPYGARHSVPGSTLVLWDLATRKPLWKLQAAAWDLAPDGKTLVTLVSQLPSEALAGVPREPASHTLTFHDVASRKVIRQIKVSGRTATVVSFSPDGKHVAYADSERVIRILERKHFKETQVLEAPRQKKDFGPQVAFLVWSRDSKRLISVTDDHAVHDEPRMLCVWDPATGKLEEQVRAPAGQIKGVCFSPDGKHLVVTTRGENWALFDGRTCKLVKEVARPGDGAVALGLYRHGMVPRDGEKPAPLLQNLWDRATGTDVSSGSYPDRLLGMALSPDDKLMATGEQNGFVRLWRFPDGKEVKRLAPVKSGPRPSGTWKFVGPTPRAERARESTYRLYFLAPGPAKHLIQSACDSLETSARHRKCLDGLKDSSAGMLVVTTGYCALRLWDLATGAYVETSDRAGDAVGISVAPEGRILLGSRQGVVQWPSNVYFPTHPDWTAQVNHVPGSANVIVWASFDQVPTLVDLKARRAVRRFGTTSVANAVVSPDGKTLATVGRTQDRGGKVADRFVRLWDIATGQECGKLAEASPCSGGIWFVPNGYSLVVQHQDGLRVWELASRQVRAFVPGPPATVNVSRDGRLLLRLTTYDKHVTVWDLTLRQELGPLQKVQLRPRQLDELHDELTGKDAARAYAALWRLAAAAEHTVPYFSARIKGFPGLDRKQLLLLLADLDSSRSDRRDRAMKELPRFGRWAYPEVVARLQKDPPLETRRRLEGLLKSINDKASSPEQMVASRMVEALEQMNTKTSRQLLEQLRDGDKPQFTEAAQEALVRMKR